METGGNTENTAIFPKSLVKLRYLAFVELTKNLEVHVKLRKNLKECGSHGFNHFGDEIG